MKKLSVIFPYYREKSDVVQDGINKISKFLAACNIAYEVIISQNGGKSSLPKLDTSIKVVYDQRAGLGLAIKNALIKSTGDYFYMLSLEIPFKFSDLREILRMDYEHYDFIIGSKLHPQSVYKTNLIRKVVSSFFTLLTSLLLPKFHVADPNGTVFGKLNKLKTICRNVKSNDFFFSTETISLAIMSGYKVKEVPITYIKQDKTTSVKMVDGIKYLSQLVKLSLRSRSSSRINFLFQRKVKIKKT